MKSMKKLLAFALVLVMLTALSVSALAADPAADRTTETDGSVSVSGAVSGQTYKLYLLFKADVGANDAITYTLPTGKTEADLTYNSKSWFELNDNGFVVAKSVTGDEWAKDPDAIAWAKSFGTQVDSAKTGPTVEWTGLEYGYYFVDSTLGAFIGVDSANKTASIQEKNTPPDIDKEIVAPAPFAATETDEKTDSGSGAYEQAIAQIGDTISYKLTVTVEPGGSNYVITDTLTNLKIVANSFKVGGAAIDGNAKVDASGTTITDGASTFTIKLADSYLNGITAETTLEITYDAILDVSAAVADEANPNTVTLTYGTNPDNKSEDGAKVWTAQLQVEKKAENEDGEPLEGAGFKLKNADGKFYKWSDTDGVTWVDEAQGDEIMTGADGKLTKPFKGLTVGTYTLVETTVPTGYNKLADTTVTITAADVTAENLSQSKIVVNEAGTELPSTGGVGTTLFYVIGAILVLGAGVVLVTKRRVRE